MSDFQKAFETISRLVRDLEENKSRFMSPRYQEAEARRDFIDRFKEAPSGIQNRTRQSILRKKMQRAR